MDLYLLLSDNCIFYDGLGIVCHKISFVKFSYASVIWCIELPRYIFGINRIRMSSVVAIKLTELIVGTLSLLISQLDSLSMLSVKELN
jgi:hypothetical protein